MLTMRAGGGLLGKHPRCEYALTVAAVRPATVCLPESASAR